MPNAKDKFNSAIKKNLPLAQAVMLGLEHLEAELTSSSKFKDFFVSKLVSEDKKEQRNLKKQAEMAIVSDYINKITYNPLSVLDILKDPNLKDLPKGDVKSFFSHVKNAIMDYLHSYERHDSLAKISQTDYTMTAYEEYLRIKIPEEYEKNWNPVNYEKRDRVKDLEYVRFELNWDLPPSLKQDARFYYVLENELRPQPPQHAYHGTSTAIFDSVLEKGLNNANATEVMHKGIMGEKTQGVTFRADDPEWVRSYALSAGHKKNAIPTILRWKITEDEVKDKGAINVYPKTVNPKDLQFTVGLGEESLEMKKLTWYPIDKVIPIQIAESVVVVPVKFVTGEDTISPSKTQKTEEEVKVKETKEEEDEESKQEFKPF